MSLLLLMSVLISIMQNINMHTSRIFQQLPIPIMCVFIFLIVYNFELIKSVFVNGQKKKYLIWTFCRYITVDWIENWFFSFIQKKRINDWMNEWILFAQKISFFHNEHLNFCLDCYIYICECVFWISES